MRLIDADALLKDIRDHSQSYFADDFAEEWVDRQPTIYPEPPKMGKWVDDGDPLMIKCGNCGYGAMRYNNTPFCPNCGARMEAITDDQTSG